MTLGKKEKTQIIITVALVMLLFVLVGRGKKTIRRAKAIKKSQAGLTKKTQTLEVEPTPAKIMSFKQLEEEAGKIDIGRDPFHRAPIIKEDLGKRVLRVSGVIWDVNEPRAIINNLVVAIGDVVSGNTVIEIKKRSVILNDGTKSFEVYIGN